jgi:hypothetical protein
LTQDSTYWNNAIYITDSLVHLDLDQDGGIPPGRGFPQTNDHSWVSSYMGWMGMEHAINAISFDDLAMVGFASPAPSLPHLAGDSLLVTVGVANNSATMLSGRVYVSGRFVDSMDVELEAGQQRNFTFAHRWVSPDDNTLPASSPLHARIVCASDSNHANDTISVGFDIRRGTDVVGAIWGDDPSTPEAAHVEFYHEAYPDSAWVTVDNPGNSVYSNGARKLMAGVNRIVVTPALKYLPADTTVTLEPSPTPYQHDFNLENTEVLLVDDDVNRTYETFYLSSLDSLNLNVRYVDRATSQVAFDLSGIPTVLWFTGDDSATSLLPEEQIILTQYLADSGNLILTGQNIPDNFMLTSGFLTTVLHCTIDQANTNVRRVIGTAGNPISDGLELTLMGSQGAGNQTSPASVHPLPGATTIFRYISPDSGVCGISGEYQGGHFIFATFGLEAISGLGITARRNAVLARCFDWFGQGHTAVHHPIVLQPNQIWLGQNYPNPFNPSTSIRFYVPRMSGLVTLSLYNVLGQRVRTLYSHEGTGQVVNLFWDGNTDDNLPASSGYYFYRLRSGSTQITKSLYLLR